MVPRYSDCLVRNVKNSPAKLIAEMSTQVNKIEMIFPLKKHLGKCKSKRGF